MGRRKHSIATGSIHHVFSKSIAGYRIFTQSFEYKRMRDILYYYKRESPVCKFSELERAWGAEKILKEIGGGDQRVALIAFCLMPTHIHLVLKQSREGGISSFMHRVLNSYTHYFNLRHSRKGPLWEGRFKNVPVESDEQLRHLTRYLHLNPVTAFLVEKPEQWEFSSYQEFIGTETEGGICDEEEAGVASGDYRNFVERQIDYQRQLAVIKHLILE